MQKYEMQKEPFIFGIFKNQNQPLSIFDNFRKSYPTLKIFYSFDFTNFVKKFALSENEATIITLVKNPALYEVPYLVQFNKSLEVKDFIIQNFYSPYDFCSNLTDFINKEKKLPKGVLYLDLDNIPKQNSTKILHAFSLVTKEFMSKIDFCIMNADAKKKKYESMELEPEGTFYIYSNIRKYRLIDQLVKDDTLNQTSLTKFIQNFLEGKIKYYRKSHDFNPDIATVPLKYIRGAEYDEVVADPSKDVYMRISDKMQLFKDERAYISMDAWINLSYEFNINGSKILLADIDSYDNDVPEELESLLDPITSIFAYLRSNKSSPILYKGNTGYMDDLRKWIQMLSTDSGIPKQKDSKHTKIDDL